KKTKDYTVYINTASIETKSETSSKAWCKTVANTKLYREFISDLRMAEGRSTDAYRLYDHTLSHVEIDCAADRHRTLEATDYDRKGKALGKPLPKEDWGPMVPDSVHAALAAWLCEEHPLLDESLNEKSED
ncbi:MAG: hypothetical protein PHN75_16450, partial [Syntrophales bacterium]|nr:hypothetical protein [Syntrophales bacterium]